jgi:hypothetical protein
MVRPGKGMCQPGTLVHTVHCELYLHVTPGHMIPPLVEYVNALHSCLNTTTFFSLSDLPLVRSSHIQQNASSPNRQAMMLLSCPVLNLSQGEKLMVLAPMSFIVFHGLLYILDVPALTKSLLDSINPMPSPFPHPDKQRTIEHVHRRLVSRPVRRTSPSGCKRNNPRSQYCPTLCIVSLAATMP